MRSSQTSPTGQTVPLKTFVKFLSRQLAQVLAAPLWLPAQAAIAVSPDPDRIVLWTTQVASTWIGPLGEYMRRAVLGHILSACPDDVCVSYGVLFSRRRARLGNRVYLGPRCNLGLVDIEDDCLLGSGVHVLSGKKQHSFERTDVPIRDQAGELTVVRVGRGTWVGNAAVILADVGAECVVGAGAVVTRQIPDGAIVGGNPARVIGYREGFASEEPERRSPMMDPLARSATDPKIPSNH